MVLPPPDFMRRMEGGPLCNDVDAAVAGGETRDLESVFALPGASAGSCKHASSRQGSSVRTGDKSWGGLWEVPAASVWFPFFL